MNRFEHSAIILSVVKKMGQKGSWCGETHIQKAIFFLQELFNIPTEFTFVLYKHGPFSFDLHDEIQAMQAERFLYLEPTPPYGVSLSEGKMGENLDRNYSNFLDNYRIQVDFLADNLGTMGVNDLEKLSTALYVTKEKRDSKIDLRADYMHKLKPHITFGDAYRFLEIVDDLLIKSEKVKKHIRLK